MSFYSQKYALEPEKVDAAVDNATAIATKVTVNAAGLVIVDLPTANPNVAGALWRNNNVVTVSTG